MNVTLPPDYMPSDAEGFMNPQMSEFFRQKLLVWRAELVEESNTTLQQLQEGGIVEADIAAEHGSLKELFRLSKRLANTQGS